MKFHIDGSSSLCKNGLYNLLCWNDVIDLDNEIGSGVQEKNKFQTIQREGNKYLQIEYEAMKVKIVEYEEGEVNPKLENIKSELKKGGWKS